MEIKRLLQSVGIGAGTTALLLSAFTGGASAGTRQSADTRISTASAALPATSQHRDPRRGPRYEPHPGHDHGYHRYHHRYHRYYHRGYHHRYYHRYHHGYYHHGHYNHHGH